MEKARLDVLLYNLGFAKSREKAKQMIVNGQVIVDNKIVTKPSELCCAESVFEINKDVGSYVGRGGYKLEKAIETFAIDLKDRICIDVGASTGGFTQVMLKNNCSYVYAVDVGTNQLAEELAANDKVKSIENTNFRYIDIKIFDKDVDFIAIDVSFISLSHILPKVCEILACREAIDVVALVKPQFEAGKEFVGKNGIVKDKKIHLKVLDKVYAYCADNSLHIVNVTYSPIKGGSGNIEYLVHIKKCPKDSFEANKNQMFSNVVQDAYKKLKD